MHLFLIRHGETEHNVAGLLAGVTDSKLTNHGVLQAERLAKHLVHDRQLSFSQLFASDLQRAFMTADEIRKAQNSQDANDMISVTKLELIREQDFGSFELVTWSSRQGPDDPRSRGPKPTDPGFKPKETTTAMTQRAKTFVDDFIIPLYASEVAEADVEVRVAVVSHGLFLGSLWRVILTQFRSENIVLDPDVSTGFGGRSLEHLPSWTNTGYLELSISAFEPGPNLDTVKVSDNQFSHIDSPFACCRLKIHAINSKTHLANLKRTRGGVGSAAYDQRQRNIDTFFKKPKTNPESNND